jgi:hypothetical protein
MLQERSKHVKYAQEVVLLLKTHCILKDILRGLSKILNELQVMIFLLKRRRRRRRRRSIKQPQNRLMQVKILTVFLFLMLKLNQEMLPIKKKINKKLKKNRKRVIKMQSTPKKTSLPTSMVKRENLRYRNQFLFLVRNTSPRKKNTTTGFVNGCELYFCKFL